MLIIAFINLHENLLKQYIPTISINICVFEVFFEDLYYRIYIMSLLGYHIVSFLSRFSSSFIWLAHFS